MVTQIEGKSQQEREGDSNDDGTVAFLLLPILVILGGGGAVECSVLHRDSGVDEIINRTTVLWLLI